MQIKISEKLFYSGIALFLMGAFMLVNTKLISSPVKVSERGIMFDVAGIVALVVAGMLIKNSIQKKQ